MTETVYIYLRIDDFLHPPHCVLNQPLASDRLRRTPGLWGFYRVRRLATIGPKKHFSLSKSPVPRPVGKIAFFGKNLGGL